ncbi:MAG: DNA primase [Ideonella sp. MAG2]|nr:MAG: DNA primase [Ideonella sp. MAG2]
MIPSGFLQELLARTDVVDIVGRHVTLKKAGINYKGLCPFHGEKSPSFIVSPSRQTYHCFGCGVHGDAIRFLTEHHGMTFVEAVHDLARSAGLQVPEDESSAAERQQAQEQREKLATLSGVLEKAAEHYKKQLKSSARAVAYLKQRGLTGEIAARFGLGYSPEGWRSLASAFAKYDDPLLVESGLVITQGDEGPEQKRYDRFRDRIMFPIRNVKGETIGFGGRVLDKGEPKYLNSPETPVFVKGRELYGLYEARTGLREKEYALVTEGYMDVVALAQLGFPNAVATLGTACTADHVQKLLRFTEQVVFSFDGDAAGRRAAGRALEAALPHATDTRSFKFLFLPPEHDPDSYIRAHGATGFETFVRNAVPLSRQLVEHASAECDLQTAEGRSRMLAQARPLWQQLPEGSLRLQLMSELARLGALPTEELARLWAASSSGGVGHSARGREGAEDGAGPGGFDRGQRRWQARGFGPQTTTSRGRLAPKKPEDRIVQMLYGNSQWWLQLSALEHDLLHGLPSPHGPAIAWLEREMTEHGGRPWAVLREALSADETLAPEVRAMADGDADPDASFEDLRSAVDMLLVKALEARKQSLLALAATDPQALQAFRQVDTEWRAVRARQGGMLARDD